MKTPVGHLCRVSVFLTVDVGFPGDAYYLAIGGGVAEHNWNHIRTVLQDQGFHCQLLDHSEDMGMISIQGPKRWEERWRMACSRRAANSSTTWLFPDG